MSEEAHDPELAAFEASLAGLVPSAGAIDRDRLMFRAGQKTAPRAWLWSGLSATLALTAATLGLALMMRPPVQSVERVVYVQVESPARHVEPTADYVPRAYLTAATEGPFRSRDQSDYLRLRQQVLRWGADVLPDPRAGRLGAPPLTFDGLIGIPPAARDSPSLFPLEPSKNQGDQS